MSDTVNATAPARSPLTTPSGGGVSKTRPARMRRFVFTINNYNESEHGAVKLLDCKWMVCAKEKGANNTPHLQGAVVLSNPMTLAAIKKRAGFLRAHIEEMKGTPEQSLAYCSKEDKEPFVKGTMPRPGKRSDLEDVAALVQGGSNLSEVADTHPTAIIKYGRGLMQLRSYYQKQRDPRYPPTVIWVHGLSGTGKTYTCFEAAQRIYGLDGVWMSAGSLKWFDGYDGQPAVILDDLRTKHAEFSFLLRLLDRYPLRVEPKHGFTNWIPNLIFVTCPYTPTDLWSLRTPEQLYQLERRITHQISAPKDLWRVSEMLLGEDSTLVLPETPKRDTEPPGPVLSESLEELLNIYDPPLQVDSDSDSQLSPRSMKKKYGWSEVNKDKL